MSKRRQKSKSASTSQKAEECSETEPLKMDLDMKKERGLIRECTKVIRGVRRVKGDVFSVLLLL